MFDMVIRNCRILDGTGNPWCKGDVGVSAGRITGVGGGAAARRVLEAGGLAAAPGFIDIHSHSDFSLHRYPRSQSRIFQGVTTEVVGNCGFSPFPVVPAHRAELERYCGFLSRDLPYAWTGAADFATFLESLPLGPNVALQIGHGAVRIAVMGFADRPATAGELAEMGAWVDRLMADGCFGLTSGLVYAPGTFAPPGELVALARVVAGHGGFYASHLRSKSDHLVEAVAEALDVGRAAGLPVQLSHHKAMGAANWGKVRTTLGMIDAERAAGRDVLADQYPYTASATSLTTHLPAWALAGGVAALLRRLADPAERARLRAALAEGDPARWQAIMISHVQHEGHRAYEGRRVSDLAAERGEHPADTVLALLEASDGAVGRVAFGMSEADVALVMRHPAVMVGSDGMATCPAAGGRPLSRRHRVRAHKRPGGGGAGRRHGCGRRPRAAARGLTKPKSPRIGMIRGAAACG